MHLYIANRWIVYRKLAQPAFKTVDTDVIAVLLANPSLFDLPYKIEDDFNFGKHRKFYKINDVCSRITPEQQLALMFFFTFIGFHITSLFFNISRTTLWNV